MSTTLTLKKVRKKSIDSKLVRILIKDGKISFKT